jgi:hypothetical protein
MMMMIGSPFDDHQRGTFSAVFDGKFQFRAADYDI